MGEKMKTFKFWVWSLLLAFIMSTQALAGAWTANEFVYKPALGARGSEEKAQFDSGADRVDARLGKEIWVGDPKNGSTLQAAVTAIGSSQVVLRVPAGTYNIAADLTIPANVTLKPERGAVLAIATTKTLTVNGGLEAGPYQIFSCTGTAKVVFKNQTIPPQWWGALPSTDKTSASQSTYIDQAVVSLLASTNCTLDFGSSSWVIDSPIWVASLASNKSGFTIRGDKATIAVKDSSPYIKVGRNTSKPIAYSTSTPDYYWSILEIFNCSDFKVSGLILDGNYTGRGVSTTAQSHGLHLAGCHRFTIDEVEAHHCQGDGIVLTAVWSTAYTPNKTIATNCSEFNLSNLILHDLARDGISVVGARNGNISNIVTYNIGSDVNNYAVSGPWHSLHFEVDPSEAAYEMAEKINVVNIFGYANRVNGGFIGISYLAKDINISNFWFTDVNISTGNHNMLMVGYNNTGIKLANGRLYKENAQASYPAYATYGIYIQSGVGSLSTVEMNNVTIVGATVGIRHDINTRLNLQNCSIENFLNYAVQGFGELIAQGNTIRYTGTGTPSPYAFGVQESGIKDIKNNYIVTANSAFSFIEVSISATKVIFDSNTCIGATGNVFNGPPLSFTGNNFRGINGLTGSFTMAAANTKAVNNVNITPYSKIFLFPTNAAAATLMCGASALYVDTTATVNYSSFTLKTADGGNAAGSETFGYLIY
jgi:hypothetical protein